MIPENVSEVGDEGPSETEDGGGVGLGLGVGDEPPSGPLKAKVKASGPGEP